MNRPIEELTLLLLYLTAWEEEVPLFGVHKRSRKDYSLAALSQLEKDGFIVNSNKSQSVFLTDAGAAMAQKLMQKYLGDKVNLLVNTASGRLSNGLLRAVISG